MTIDWLVLAVAFAGVFTIGFMKGAFGGGFAIIEIPLLALVMTPIEAGTMLAPLFVVMDLYALRTGGRRRGLNSTGLVTVSCSSRRSSCFGMA